MVEDFFSLHNLEIVEYPESITKKCYTIEDISSWVFEHYFQNNQNYDFILGHSMGGMIGLYILSSRDIHCDQGIIVETFLKPPPILFRNLIMDSNKELLEDTILTMLKKEAPNYTNELLTSLKEEFDLTEYLNRIACPLHFLYGNRGITDKDLLMNNVNLNQNHLSRINISFVDNACHFPMLENPKQFKEIFQSILLDNAD